MKKNKTIMLIVPDIVKEAVEHVQKSFPDVDRVVYDREGRWRFENGDGVAPLFKGHSIDVGILEDAADFVLDSGIELPATFLCGHKT